MTSLFKIGLTLLYIPVLLLILAPTMTSLFKIGLTLLYIPVLLLTLWPSSLRVTPGQWCAQFCFWFHDMSHDYSLEWSMASDDQWPLMIKTNGCGMFCRFHDASGSAQVHEVWGQDSPDAVQRVHHPQPAADLHPIHRHVWRLRPPWPAEGLQLVCAQLGGRGTGLCSPPTAVHRLGQEIEHIVPRGLLILVGHLGVDVLFLF